MVDMLADLRGVCLVLSVLGSLAVPHRSLSRLPEGEGCRAGKGERAVWDGKRANGIGVKGKYIAVLSLADLLSMFRPH